MGQKNSRRESLCKEKRYFDNVKNNIQKEFVKVDGFLENSSKWVVIFREELGKYSKYSWGKSLLKYLKNWESFQDLSSKGAFVWSNINVMRSVSKIDTSRTCLWPQSINNLQTFSYELDSDPIKRSLDLFLTQKNECSLCRIIKKFKIQLLKYYCNRTSSRFVLKNEFLADIEKTIQEIDRIVLDFIAIIVKIIPKFFLGLPSTSCDIECVVRNAVISNEILSLLILVRKGSFREVQNSYIKSLASFGELSIDCEVLEKLEKDRENYIKAKRSLIEINECSSIGQIHDSVAMLMNHISKGLFDEDNPNNVVDECELIKAFLLVVGKSNMPDLPVYVSILNTFLDNHTLDIKDIGKGIHKLTFIINNTREWSSFISN